MAKLDGEELDIYVAASTLSNGRFCYALGKEAVTEFKDDLKEEKAELKAERAAAKEERAKLKAEKAEKAEQAQSKGSKGSKAGSPLGVKKPKHMKYKCVVSEDAPLKLIFKKL
jgi:sRNA-binding protein